MRILFFIFVTITFSTYSSAADVSVSTPITRILNYEGHSGTLYVPENASSTNGFCPRNDFYILPLSHQYYTQNYSLLLAAKLAGKKVVLVLSNGNCVENMPKILHVSLEE